MKKFETFIYSKENELLFIKKYIDDKLKKHGFFKTIYAFPNEKSDEYNSIVIYEKYPIIECTISNSDLNDEKIKILEKELLAYDSKYVENTFSTILTFLFDEKIYNNLYDEYKLNQNLSDFNI